jgi:hypothetical protein
MAVIQHGMGRWASSEGSGEQQRGTISPGSRLKNFFPAFELAIELVKWPVTFTTPDSIPVATFSDIFVTFLALPANIRNTKMRQHNQFKQGSTSYLKHPVRSLINKCDCTGTGSNSLYNI